MTKHPPSATLSIDISLDTLDVGLWASDGEHVWPHRAYANNWPGYQALRDDLLAHLGAGDGLTVLAESTGMYWWHLYQQIAHDLVFEPHDPQLILLNPAHVKHFRKALPEQDKTDMLDPDLIERFYQTTGSQHPQTMERRYGRLRFLTRAYCRLSHTLAAEKAYCQSVLYLLASDYQRQRPFKPLLSVTSRRVLDAYPDIAALAEMPLAEVTAALHTFSRGKFAAPEEKARQLQQVARDSYPLPPELHEMLTFILQQTLDLISVLENHKHTYEERIKAELADFPEANLALAESGLGPVLVAGFLSEIQDTRRFTTGTKYDRRRKHYRPRVYRDGQAAVAKLAGLWWPRRDSGRFQADERRLSRERNPYLRYWFVQAAYTLRQHRPQEYGAYYWKKFHESHNHPHKRALTLTARKAVRLVFALLHKGQRTCLEEAPIV